MNGTCSADVFRQFQYRGPPPIAKRLPPMSRETQSRIEERHRQVNAHNDDNINKIETGDTEISHFTAPDCCCYCCCCCYSCYAATAATAAAEKPEDRMNDLWIVCSWLGFFWGVIITMIAAARGEAEVTQHTATTDLVVVPHNYPAGTTFSVPPPHMHILNLPPLLPSANLSGWISSTHCMQLDRLRGNQPAVGSTYYDAIPQHRPIVPSLTMAGIPPDWRAPVSSKLRHTLPKIVGYKGHIHGFRNETCGVGFDRGISIAEGL